jgi:transcriptional regulator with XRE-family HTH domain
MKFSEVLKTEREKTGLTQAALADCLHVGKSTVSMWENGKRMPDFEKLEEIADLFNIDLNRLRGDFQEDKRPIQTIAAHSIRELTDEEIKKLIEYAQFLKSQRK